MYLKLNVDEGIKTKVDLTLVQTVLTREDGAHWIAYFSQTDFYNIVLLHF